MAVKVNSECAEEKQINDYIGIYSSIYGTIPLGSEGKRIHIKSSNPTVSLGFNCKFDFSKPDYKKIVRDINDFLKEKYLKEK